MFFVVAAARMVSYEKQRSKTFYTSNRREEDKLYFDKAIDSVNIAKEVRNYVFTYTAFTLIILASKTPT